MIAGLVLVLGGAAAGLFGSLLGLGGGILLVPLMTLVFGLPLREAVAISLISVIVTSSASAAVYLERHVANLRLGMTLELFSAAGALVGGLVAFMIDEQILAGLFAALLTWVAISMVRRKDPPKAGAAAPVEAALIADAAPSTADDGSFAASLSGPGYRVHRIPLGMAGSVVAGLNSALLGVGGGIIKVPVMHLVMGVPLRTSTATSNMMMGITAVSSAVIYLLRGEIDPFIAGPIALGVFVGASTGPRLAHRIPVKVLRGLFVIVLVYTAFQMARKALGI
ncbi:MAG: sulfite exporter TauE/SafE family protein [Chloroflexota bacterium]